MMLSRMRVFLAVILTSLVIFSARLMYLQVSMAETLRTLSDENVWEEQRITPLRGRILARDGTVLADNRIAVDLMYWGGEVKHWDKIKFLLNIDEEPSPPDLTDVHEREAGKVLAWNIPDSLVSTLEELVAGQPPSPFRGKPSLYLRDRIERTYPTNLAAQVVGYTTEADPERFPGYALGDLVGQMGIEASFQEELFGAAGAELVKVNNRRVVLNREEILAAEPGQDIMLTIDPILQKTAEDVLLGALQYVNARRDYRGLDHEELVKGAIIALNPKTGEILAMASMPSFDQNVFTHRPSNPDKVTELLNDTETLPMSNRAVQAYPPASTFKLVSSSTLLEHNYITTNTQYFCSSYLDYGGIRWENWSYPNSRGTYTIVDAIADSCNTFFWRAALATPNIRKGWAEYAQNLTQRAKDLGYGEKVGIGLDEEKSGRIPTDEWMRAYFDHGWRSGDSLNVSIGQGDTLATPIQNAQALITFIMDGTQIKPHLIKRIDDTVVTTQIKTIPGRHWATLRKGMRHMITDYGSSYYLGARGNFPIEVAGKTGTAQNSLGTGYDHTWFIGYGPINDPELALVVFIEKGDSSSAVAVPTARDFMAAFWDVKP